MAGVGSLCWTLQNSPGSLLVDLTGFRLSAAGGGEGNSKEGGYGVSALNGRSGELTDGSTVINLGLTPL